VVSGRRLLTAVGLWLLASVLAGAATVSVATGLGLAGVTPAVPSRDQPPRFMKHDH
jgi:hypothetical protein